MAPRLICAVLSFKVTVIGAVLSYEITAIDAMFSFAVTVDCSVLLPVDEKTDFGSHRISPRAGGVLLIEEMKL